MSESIPSETGGTGSSLRFPGLDTTEHLDMSQPQAVKIKHLDSGLAHKLGEWRSTAICGNDITSSCLYVAALRMISAGRWLHVMVSIDAVLVLSGAVLTSYVGVTGLVRRMTLDRCLPQFLLRENEWCGTNHWIIVLFFLLCCSILMITAGGIEALAGVYTLSFLGVMALFAIGNLLLKVKRARLPRAVRAGWPTVVIGLLAVCIGLLGNLLINPAYVRVFGIYFAIALAIVGVMFLRVQILKVALVVSRTAIERMGFSRWIIDGIDRINSQGVIFFTRGDNLVTLNRAALYVLENEQTKRL